MMYSSSENRNYFCPDLTESEKASLKEKRFLISSPSVWSKATTANGISSSLSSTEEKDSETYDFSGPKRFIQNVDVLWNHVENQTTKVRDSLEDVKDSYQLYLLSLALLGMGFLLIFFSFLFFPVVILSPKKFAVPFTVGSFIILNGMGLLRGYGKLFHHFIHPSRCIFSIAYFLSLIATMYTIFYLQSYFLTLGLAITQMVCLFLLLFSYVIGTDRLTSLLQRGSSSSATSLGWNTVSYLI